MASQDGARFVVAVDASWFGPSARGMARHAMTLLASDSITPVLLNQRKDATRDHGAFIARLPQPLFEQFLFHPLARRRHADACLSPYNTAPLAKSSLPQVTVIHDLIYMASGVFGRGSARQAIGRLYRRWIVPHAARRATALVTVSSMMKTALVNQFEVEPSRVFVVPNTADPDLYQPYSVTMGETVQILTVSGTAPHKNLRLLLACTARLREEGLPVSAFLVGVSQREGARMLRSLDLDSHFGAFTFLKGITRTHLHSLYRGAWLFVMPSLAEGFGIPLLEALAAGLPCVASDIPIFREIAGEDCSYFYPASLDGLVAAVRQSVHAALDRRGCAVHRKPALSAQRFSPSEVAIAVDRLWSHLRNS